FFFKQKTAYELRKCLEFRRVLFRSARRTERGWYLDGERRHRTPCGAGKIARSSAFVRPHQPAANRQEDDAVWFDCRPGVERNSEIGRASCRERRSAPRVGV